MQVLCIDASTNTAMGFPPEIKEGEKYTVIGETHPFDVPSYKLAETVMTYGKFRFVPVSDIDETIMERDYNKQLI